MSTNEEIVLLERVLLKLGCTDTDEQLEASINKFLGPVLLKIDSPNEETRKKVMEILTHINKRLKSRPTVKVPLETILTMYKQSNSSFLLNFAIIYIILGFPRIDHDKSVELVPLLLNCLEGKPEIHQDKLLHLILPLLGELKIPAEKVQEILGLADKPNTKRQFLSLMLDMLLLPYGVTSESELPPGFSPYSFKRAISGNLKAEDLEQLKKGIVTFICKGAFPDSEVLPLLIVASADTRFSIATTAIQELSKIGNSLDWTSAELTAPLYALISGNGSKIPDRKTTPTNTRVRQKMIQYLLKCRGAGLSTAKGIQVIFESLFGTNTNQKSKVLALQFTDVLILHSDRELIKKLSVVLLTGLSKLIGPEAQEPADVQNNAYNAIARLATVCPDTMNKDVNLIVKYFESLHHAPPEMHSYIREALVALAQAFAWEQVSTVEQMDVDRPSSSSSTTSNNYSFTPDKNQILLIGLLAEKAESKSTIVQNIASVFLTTCFPDYYVPARYLLLIIAGSSPMLNEMVTSYLYGNSKKDNINYAYVTTVDNPTAANEKQTNLLTAEQRFIILPSFKEMVKYVHEKAEKKSTVSEKHSGKMHLAYTYDMFTEILEYLRLCLWFSAGITEFPSEEEKNKRIGHYLRQLFDQNETQYVQMYNDLTKCMVISRKGPVELGCMWDMIGAAPELIVSLNIDLLEPLKFGLGEISENERTLIAKIYGTILAYGISDDIEFHKYVDDLLLLQSRSFESQHGSILAVSHAMFRKLSKLKKENRVRFETISNWPPFIRTVETLVTLLVSPHYLMLKASIEGIGLIGSILPLPLKEQDENVQIEESEVAQLTKQYLLKTLLKNLRSAHSRGQISEQSALCLGYLTNGDENYFTKKVLQGFLDLIKLTKNPSIHIAIAQSLVITIEGKSIVDTSEHDAGKSQTSDEIFDWLLEEIIKVVPNPHPNSRQAAAFFLLALLKNCSTRTPIQKRRHMLQDVFIDLLSEDNEMVQDLASRGLGLIYSMCDSGTREQLSNVLLEKLTGNKKQVMKVTEDTKVFEEGVLGNAPTGGQLSTYKELCALASDLNQPEMIYQFMQLANHNATFNSKLGAAFGIKSISKVAKVSMQAHLGKIVPRLFRYKYDPTPKIQNSMISIWESVVVDSKATIEKYYWEILDDVLNNLTSSDWRTRMSCCLGARDLIKRPQGLKLRSDDRTSKASNSMDTDMSVLEPELLFLWQQLFRVMDDYHEGTRQAAEGTVKLLSKVCVVAASGHGKSGMNVSSSILPFILESGVTHNVSEIRQLSIKTVSELIESSGSLIQPHLDILIPCLLKATGELDSVKLSYLSNMFGSDSRTQEAVDTIRADMAKQHHTMDALNRCIRFVDYAALEKMTPAILDIMKTTVQLGTKVACAHYICLVTVHLGNQMTPLSGKYLSTCLSGISDRNPTVKKYYASAIGHLVGIAKDQSISKLFEKLTEAYFDPESNKAKAIPLVIHAIHKKYPELLKDFSGEIIPLIFVAIHEEVTEESRQHVENWKDVFHEVSAGDIGIKFNLEKICNRLEQCFQSQVFTVKAQSARSINTLATRLNKDLSDDDRRKLIKLLINNITGRTYKGKENILEALASLSKHWKTDESNLHIRVIDAVMKEARKKENPVYKTNALKAIGNILEALEEDRFEEIYNMVWFIMDKTNLSFDGDEDDDNATMTADEKNKQMLILGNLKEAVCEALGKAWPLNSIETQQKYQLMFAEKCTNCLQSNTRQVQLSLMAALGKFVEKLHILNASSDQIDPQEKKVKLDANTKDLNDIMHIVLKAITDVSNIPHSGLRKEALNIILLLLKKLQALKDSKNHLILLKQTFLQILPNFQKDNSPEIKCRLKEIEEKIK